jgi:hypothetical protein
MHRDKREDCTIMYSNGDTYDHKFSGRPRARDFFEEEAERLERGESENKGFSKF